MVSGTDTEVLAHLIEQELADSGRGLAEAVRVVLPRLRGSFSIAVVSADEPDTIVAARRKTPLVLGLQDGVAFLASDIPALIGHTRRVFALADDELAVLTPGALEVTTPDGDPVEPEQLTITWDLESAQKGGFEDYMSKEMDEQPKAVADTLLDRRGPSGELILDEMRLSPDDLRNIDKVFIVACGSSYHAALVAKYAIEHWVKLPTEVDIASEFRYRDPVLNARTLCVGVSQSGETLDTLAALRYAKEQGQHILAVVNQPESTVAREAGAVLATHAGPEIGVASTKAFTTQLAVLACFTLAVARARGTLTAQDEAKLSTALTEVPARANDVLQHHDAIQKIAAEIAEARDVLYLGRGTSFPLALEGALKLKEISYIHAEGYAAGEMKHGPIALIDEKTPVIVLAPRDELFDKTCSNIQEVMARGGKVVMISDKEGLARFGGKLFHGIEVPPCHPFVAPLLYSVPVQLLAYDVAVLKGTDVDQPRNLAKSVTVE